MRVFNNAKVYLVGKQELSNEEIENFLNDEGTEWKCTTDIDGQRMPELAGRMCYMSFGSKQGRKTNESYLNHIIGVGHGSVLEHTVYNFIISGVSRSLTHELVRHRAGFGYSQLSQRYVDSKDAGFVMPPALQDTDLEQDIKSFYQDSLDKYESLTDTLADNYAIPEKMFDFAAANNILIQDGDKWTLNNNTLTKSEWVKTLESLGKDSKLLKFFKKKTLTARRKAAREAARCVLPNGTETKIFVTANARALRHFLELRGSIHAEAEIRALACDMCKMMKKEAPNLFGDFEVIKLPDGSSKTETKNSKV